MGAPWRRLSELRQSVPVVTLAPNLVAGRSRGWPSRGLASPPGLSRQKEVRERSALRLGAISEALRRTLWPHRLVSPSQQSLSRSLLSRGRPVPHGWPRRSYAL